MPKINKTYKKRKYNEKQTKKKNNQSLVFDASKTHPASILPNYKKYEIRKSPIHGNGIFATQDIQPRETIDCALKQNGTSYTITPFFGRLVNHSSKKYNVELIRFNDGNYYGISTKFIPKNTEITANYDDITNPDFLTGSKPHYV